MANRIKTLTDFKEIHNPSERVRYLLEKLGRAESQLEAQKKITGEYEEIISTLNGAIQKAKPVPLVYKPQSNSQTPITQVMHLTDLHYGEVVDKDEVDGFNEFNPEIAKARLHDLGQKVLKKVQIQRAGYKAPYLHIFGTGDYISGDIHKELQVTNAFPCPQQAVECGYTLGGLVMMMAPHYEHVVVDMITLDNHGRMTVKNQAAQGGLNNWGYVVAQIVKQHCARQKNVTVNVHAKASALVQIGMEKFLLFHGHQIKGWAGLPYYGFDRRVAMEAVKRMGLPETSFTKMLMGHFHVSVDSPNWIIGGSLSGTNAFDHACGRHMQAHQTSWFVHPKHGMFDFVRWWL